MLIPNPSAQAGWLAWASQLATVLQPTISRIEASMMRRRQVVELAPFSVADLPAPVRGGWIYVTDEMGGEVPAFSDGSDWRRCTDRAVVS